MPTDNWEYNTPWRKIASTIYRKPIDSKIFGQSDIDVSALDDYVSQKRREGMKTTFTHLFAYILGRCLQDETPEFNTYMRLGRIKARPSVDVMVSVLRADTGMGSVLLERADTLSLIDIEETLQKAISTSRQGDEQHNKKSKDLLPRLPWPIRGWFFRIYKLIVIDLGLSIRPLGLNANSFGSVVLTNIGSIGLDTGYPALMPSSNVALVFVMGGIQKKPIVINDEVVIRKIMTVSVAIDHRMADASHGGKLLRYIKRAVQNPEAYFSS
jgi:pyruvate dehydrogenase E2 component (dihydrolipoamide acetyltransferase)